MDALWQNRNGVFQFISAHARGQQADISVAVAGVRISFGILFESQRGGRCRMEDLKTW